MGGREKRHAHQRVKAGKSTPLQYTGPLKAQAGQQSAHPAPGSKQQTPQPAQTPEAAAARPQMTRAPKGALDPDEQPTPPRLPIASKTPPVVAPAQPQNNPASRDGWMPPAEDTVAKFLSDVADIAPQPARERPEDTSPAFFLSPSNSPEEAKRKRDSTQPFWSEMQSAHLANQETGETAKPRGRGAKFTRRRVIWIPVIIGIVLLGLLAALAVPYLASRHRQPTLRPTPTGLNTVFRGPTPTPVALQSLQMLLQEQAPACSSTGQDFWDFPNFQKSCAGDGLHLTNTQQIPVVGELLSINGATLDPDTIVVVQVSLASGKPTDSIGLVTRFSAQDGYFFGIDAAGHWQMSLWEQAGGQPRVFGSGISTTLHSGLGATNTLEVISQGTHFTFYVNQTWLYSFSDSTHSAGHIGLAIKGAGDQAIFSNFSLYDTPQG